MTQQEKPGLIGIVGGKFEIVDPENGGKRAILYPPEEGAIIYVNGEELDTPLQCESRDTIHIEPTTYMEDARIDVKISPDGLYALAAVFPRVIIFYKLQDAAPAHSLKPVLEKQEKTVKVVTLDQAERELRENKVVIGLSIAALNGLVQNADGSLKTVARGKAMEEGKDGVLEFIINPDPEVISYEQEGQRVDFREKYRYPAVKTGDVIAVLHPPQPGIPGQKVTGEMIVPKPVKDVKIRCGEGVELSQDQKEVTAQKDGRLVVLGNHIKVVDLLVHSGDVNLETGNLRFNGEIRIFGNVTEGMLVEARSSLLVQGSCYGATLQAGEAINVNKNIIKSMIQGGIFFSLLRELSVLMEQLAGELETFVKNLKRVLDGLIRKGREVDEGYLKQVTLMLLIKSTALQDSLTALLRKLEQHYNYTGLEATVNALKSLEELLSLKAPAYSLDVFVNLLETIGSLKQSYFEILGDIPPLTASYIQNSTVGHSGDIEISGAGCYFSTLQAGGEVRVGGVFRGGIIRAGANVRVKEFVCIATAAESLEKKSMIRIRVPAQAAIYFGQVYEDTTVQIGKMIYHFDRAQSRVKINLDSQEGLLKLSNY